MQNGANVPIIGSKKIVPMEPFHIDGLGWFNPTNEITAQHLSHILIILITLISPRPAHIIFDLGKYGEDNDLKRFFTDEKPQTVKELECEKVALN